MVSRQRLDEAIGTLMQEQRIPGLALLVARRGEAVVARGYGLANIELGVPVSAESAFEIASVTKLFTAQAVMQLVVAGQVELDTSLREYLRDLPEAWAGATVRHVLTHSSGIPNYTAVPRYWETTRLDVSKEEIVGLVLDKPLEFEPGTNWSYSNTGYYLLGLLIEATSGQPYGDYLHSQIFDPLGMSATRTNNPYSIVPGRVSGYTLEHGALRNVEYYSPSGTYSAGALLTTASDMLKWDAALYGDAILPQEVIRQMWTPAVPPKLTEQRGGFTTCLGWFVFEQFWGCAKRWAGHNGSVKGFSSALVRFLDDDVTVCLLVNRDGFERPDKIIADLLPLVPFGAES